MDAPRRDDVPLRGRLISVNVGEPKRVDSGRRIVETAIWKDPVEGRVAVRGVNLEGDRQADLSVHGGPDKAVYAYAIEETRLWEEELGRPLGPGAWGENLTTEGIDVSGAILGERWRIGTTLLEVVQPRLPCFKLALKMGDPTFVRRFGQASRPGAYLKIVEEGELGAGDAIEVDVAGRPDHGVDVRLVSDAFLVDHSLIPRAQAAPQLIEGLREQMARLAP
ncbi:MAG TPA: MOSC domain-containing protein [Solirubrobacterales bacterium]|jgi:MOSC domain-containing protein YiiM|nr:MOSC domain-containing protein [Solirubrobacterales bacterium]